MTYQGPNVKRLIVYKMCQDAIPDGGGLADAIAFLTDQPRMKKAAKDATEWVQAAILAVRKAAEPNPWRDSTDEAIAGEILLQIERRKGSNKT